MTRSRWFWLTVALGLAVLAAAYLGSGGLTNSPSVTNKGAFGLYATYEYLRGQGWPVQRWERPLGTLGEARGTLVIACPLTRSFNDNDEHGLTAWLNKGNSVVLLTSGREPVMTERSVQLGLGLEPEKIPREPPPLNWWTWKQWQVAESELQPTQSGRDKGLQTARTWRGTHGIDHRLSADVWMDDTSELDPDRRVTRVAEVRRGRGRVLVVNNVSSWANGWIAAPGNVENVEQILRELTPEGGRIYFDEWHQGFGTLEGSAREDLTRPSELLVGHLLLIYLLAVWTLSRRFGGVMPSEPPTGSTASRPLLALAQLHRQSGHTGAAGGMLLAISRREADRKHREDLNLPESFKGGERELLQLAQQIGRWQNERGATPASR